MRKLLIIVPAVVALVLVWLFLPAREVSIEPYGMLSLETKVTLSVGSEVAYASPGTEYLLNPSFTGGTTDWTLDTTTYDPAVYQDTAGSIKTITEVKRNDAKTGTCSQTIGTAINSTDTVKLSLWWKKGFTGSVDFQDLKAQIARPSAPTIWIDIWSDTQTGNIDWTEVADFDVSAYFTETGTYQFRYYMYVENPNDPTAQVWAWIDNTHLDVTPAAVPDISNLPISKDFGFVAESNSYWSNGSAPTFPLEDGECYFTVTNNGSGSVNISIKATDFTGGDTWTLVTTVPVQNEVRLTVWESGESEGDGINLITSDSGFISNLAATASKKWELRLTTGTFTDGVGKTSTITLTATFV